MPDPQDQFGIEMNVDVHHFDRCFGFDRTRGLRKLARVNFGCVNGRLRDFAAGTAGSDRYRCSEQESLAHATRVYALVHRWAGWDRQRAVDAASLARFEVASIRPSDAKGRPPQSRLTLAAFVQRVSR